MQLASDGCHTSMGSLSLVMTALHTQVQFLGKVRFTRTCVRMAKQARM